MDLLNLKQVCSIMQISPSTVYRRVADSRMGISTFPLPIHGSRKKRLWKADDIMFWSEDMPEIHRESPASQKRHLKAVHKELLKEFGIKVGDEETN